MNKRFKIVLDIELNTDFNFLPVTTMQRYINRYLTDENIQYVLCKNYNNKDEIQIKDINGNNTGIFQLEKYNCPFNFQLKNKHLYQLIDFYNICGFEDYKTIFIVNENENCIEIPNNDNIVNFDFTYYLIGENYSLDYVSYSIINLQEMEINKIAYIDNDSNDYILNQNSYFDMYLDQKFEFLIQYDYGEYHDIIKIDSKNQELINCLMEA